MILAIAQTNEHPKNPSAVCRALNWVFWTSLTWVLDYKRMKGKISV